MVLFNVLNVVRTLFLLGAILPRPVLAVRGDACGKYACGSATWSWDTASSIKDVSLSIKDNYCDGKYSYIYLDFTYVVLEKIYHESHLRLENHDGCHAKNKVKNTSSASGSFNIRGITVVACRSDALRDTCYSSGYYENPKA